MTFSLSTDTVFNIITRTQVSPGKQMNWAVDLIEAKSQNLFEQISVNVFGVSNQPWLLLMNPLLQCELSLLFSNSKQYSNRTLTFYTEKSISKYFTIGTGEPNHHLITDMAFLCT